MQSGLRAERDPQNLASQLEQLRELSPAELRDRWHTLFGAAPPPKLRVSLLMQAITCRLQEQVLGGLKPDVCRATGESIETFEPTREVPPMKTASKLACHPIYLRL
jgi:hypothetical protein